MENEDGGDDSNATVITTETGDSAVVHDDGTVEVTWSDGTTETYDPGESLPTPTEH